MFKQVNERLVTVTIEGDIVSCDPPNLGIIIDGDYKIIRFNLAPKFQKDYQFADTGAVVMNGNTSQFPGPSITEDPPISAFVYNAGSVPGIFKYTVYVMEKKTGKFLRTDPIIENHP